MCVLESQRDWVKVRVQSDLPVSGGRRQMCWGERVGEMTSGAEGAQALLGGPGCEPSLREEQVEL